MCSTVPLMCLGLLIMPDVLSSPSVLKWSLRLECTVWQNVHELAGWLHASPFHQVSLQ